MRENMGIYRGKRKDTGEWVNGNLFLSDTDGRAYILAGSRIVTIEWEVDPSTVGQFTGLLDKNGKRIFDGDLVIPTNRRRLTNKHQVVEYCPLSGYWQCAPAREPVVIGNIHDNPELLEVSEND